MIDIHCHILPEMDDGASDIYDTLEMAYIASQNGTDAIVATPHCNAPGGENYFDSHFIEIFKKAQTAIQNENIPIKLIGGMEVFVTYDLPELIVNEKILTINNSDYMLIEFDFNEDPEFVDIMVERLMQLDLKPVIAHPERYEFIRNNIDFAQRLVAKGCVLQANKGSFLGAYGSRTESTAFSLVTQNLISVVASDAHNPMLNTPDMTQAKSFLEDIYPVKKLFEENPLKICMNKPLLY